MGVGLFYKEFLKSIFFPEWVDTAYYIVISLKGDKKSAFLYLQTGKRILGNQWCRSWHSSRRGSRGERVAQHGKYLGLGSTIVPLQCHYNKSLSLCIGLVYISIHPLHWKHAVSNHHAVAKRSRHLLIVGKRLDEIMYRFAQIAVQQPRQAVLMPRERIFPRILMDANNEFPVGLLSQNRTWPMRSVGMICVAFFVPIYVPTPTVSIVGHQCTIRHCCPGSIAFPISLYIIFRRGPVLTSSKQIWMLGYSPQIPSDKKVENWSFNVNQSWGTTGCQHLTKGQSLILNNVFVVKRNEFRRLPA
jgi:hypothetical protein